MRRLLALPAPAPGSGERRCWELRAPWVAGHQGEDRQSRKVEGVRVRTRVPAADPAMGGPSELLFQQRSSAWGRPVRLVLPCR